ncbi:hypothetical protein PYW07_011028 [Mythimna separata]|uniref:Uncharacterized protein n=1 Tax=Mythimna separata TaxID=271217 RepID=A0AAD7Y749_MYTSE|nr:hypothetical protein PYW07_011028 [Mythimna separata]
MFMKKCIPDPIPVPKEEPVICPQKKPKKKCIKKPEEKKPVVKPKRLPCSHIPCLCIERVKNPPVGPKNALEDPRFVCAIKPVLPGSQRCKEIFDLSKRKPELPYPRCPPPPDPPVPPKLDPCEIQERRKRIEECKRRMKRYME